MKIRILGSLAALALGLAPALVRGEDIALVISNQTYAFDGPVGGNAATSALAHDLRAKGWTVVAGGETKLVQMLNLATELQNRIRHSPGGDRVVIALNGRFVQSKRDTWLLQRGIRKPDGLSAGANGLSLGMLAEIAANGAAGQAIILMGLPDTASDPESGLQHVRGLVDLPQGVTLVTGSMDALGPWARDSLLQDGKSLGRALTELPQGAKVSGFRSGIASFGKAVGSVNNAAPTSTGPMGEMAYWNAVRDIGSTEALEAYLARYPNGIFAAEARAKIDNLAPPDPTEIARAQEAALGLNRDARRQIQRNLDLLGFNPRGIDGVFGRGSRAAIAAWQRVSGYEDNGFLTAPQMQELRRQADVRAAELEREAQRRREEQEREDRRYWGQLGRDEGSLRLYLEKYPDGLFSETAQAQLDRIMEQRRAEVEARERVAWDHASELDSIAGYQDFVNRFPRGSFAAEAKKRMAEKQAAAANAGKIEQLKRVEAQVVPGQTGRLIVEQILAAKGLKPGPTDGKFTRETRRAIRRFQKANGLAVNGYITQRTMVVLMLGR